MDADLGSWCEELKLELAAGRGSGRSKKWRCPAELRSRIVSFTRACRERGEPYLDIAVRLGLVESTLTRWMRTERVQEEPGFRPVSIVPACEHQVEVRETSGGLRLITPQGFTVEGLDVNSLAHLLQVLQ
jgi:transposase-like protein